MVISRYEKSTEIESQNDLELFTKVKREDYHLGFQELVNISSVYKITNRHFFLFQTVWQLTASNRILKIAQKTCDELEI